ncbi:hypothetical protein K449DRAFT_354771, partial [Hypoxylon sp. EC38]
MSRFVAYVPFIPFHHILMILNVLAIALWSILLAGCSSSNGLRSVYLLSLSYKPNPTAPLTDPLQVNPSMGTTFSDTLGRSNSTIQQINVSHMSICIELLSGTWICGSNAQELVNDIMGDPESDPFNLVWAADKFQSESTFYPLFFVAIIFTFVSTLLLATFPGWREEPDSDVGSGREIKPFPSRPVSNAALALSSLATLLSFVSVFWQHVVSACAQTLFETLAYGTIEVHVGPAAMICGWFAFGLICITSLGLLIMVLSIRVLSMLAD